jgi:hypothetical protein
MALNTRPHLRLLYQPPFDFRPEHIVFVPVLPIERVAARIIDGREGFAEAGPDALEISFDVHVRKRSGQRFLVSEVSDFLTRSIEGTVP